MGLVIGYARVSSAEQSENSHALESQIFRLTEHGCDEVWAEQGKRTSDRRPKFRKLWEAIKSGQVSVVKVARIDRLTGRLDTLKQFVNDCMATNTHLVAIDQGIDTQSTHGRLMFNILGSLSEFEIDMLQDRVNKGWEFLQKNQRAPGIVPFGYERINERYALSTQEYFDSGKTRAEVAAEYIDCVIKAGGLHGGLREMNRRYHHKKRSNMPGEDYPREQGLKRWLYNPVLRGHIAYYYRYYSHDENRQKTAHNKQVGKPIKIIPNQHEALISPEQWDLLERILVARIRERDPNDWRVKPLAGMVYCAACGCKAKAFFNRKQNVTRWYCTKAILAIPGCQNRKGLRDDTLQETIISHLITRGKGIRQIIKDQSNSQEQVFIDPKLQQLMGSIEQMRSLPQNPAIEAAIADMERQVEVIRQGQSDREIVQNHLAFDLLHFAQTPDFWKWLKDNKRRLLYLQFVEQVQILEGVVVSVSLRV